MFAAIRRAWAAFNIFSAAERRLGKERVIALYYTLVYWWIGRVGLSAFNYGYMPLSHEVTEDPLVTEPYQMEMYRQAALALGPDKLAGRVLEISCGLGGGADFLQRHFPAGTYVGMDRTFVALRHARRRFALRGVRADAKHLPFADQSFDVVVNIEASHIYYGDDFLAGVTRVLRHGGCLVLADERDTREGQTRSTFERDLALHGLQLVSFRTLNINVADACVADTPRREAVLAGVPFPVRHSVRQMIGVSSTQRVATLRDGRASYVLLVAQRLF